MIYLDRSWNEFILKCREYYYEFQNPNRHGFVKTRRRKNCVDKFVRYRSINKDVYLFFIAYLFSKELHIKRKEH
jgi:hypothetical protein